MFDWKTVTAWKVMKLPVDADGNPTRVSIYYDGVVFNGREEGRIDVPSAPDDLTAYFTEKGCTEDAPPEGGALSRGKTEHKPEHKPALSPEKGTVSGNPAVR